jgi:hypothetical protein
MYRWRPLGTARLRWHVAQTWTRDAPPVGQRRSASWTLAGKGRPPPAAPTSEPRLGNRLVRGSPGGVWARDIPCIDGLSLVTGMVVPSTLRVQTTRTMIGAWAIWHHEPDRLRLGRWDSNPESDSSACAGQRHDGALTCGFSLPLVTARARRVPEVAGVMRTQRGPLGFGSPPAGRPDPLLAKPDRAGSPPGQTTNGAGHGGRGIVRGCPLATARVRCEWHGSGTAGENREASRVAALSLGVGEG